MVRVLEPWIEIEVQTAEGRDVLTEAEARQHDDMALPRCGATACVRTPALDGGRLTAAVLAHPGVIRKAAAPTQQAPSRASHHPAAISQRPPGPRAAYCPWP